MKEQDDPSCIPGNPEAPGASRLGASTRILARSIWSGAFAVVIAAIVGVMNLMPQCLAGSGVPLTDLVLFGAVYNTSGQQVTGALPTGSKIAVFVDGLVTPGTPATPTVIAETAQLLDPGTGVAQFYVLRIKRMAGVTTEHVSSDDFVLNQDRLHIYLDWNHNGIFESSEEVAQTRTASVLVTDAQHDVRFISLNSPGTDVDADGLPDDWEIQFLGGTGQGANDDSNHDQVNNRLAWAMGLNPNLNNSSKMPFLKKDESGKLVLFFRLSATATGVTYRIESSNGMSPGTWQVVNGATVEEVGVEGTSRIMKATIAEGFDRPSRFFRINWP